jgi:hypothetical protein
MDSDGEKAREALADLCRIIEDNWLKLADASRGRFLSVLLTSLENLHRSSARKCER